MRFRANLDRIDKVLRVVGIVMVIGAAGMAGFLFGFHEAAGYWPSFTEQHAITVPAQNSVVTANEAKDTIAVLKDKSYQEGYNCLDYAWEAMRLMQWKGHETYLVRLDLDPDPDHAIILIGTEDEGWIFVEPQTGETIKPTVGGKYQHLQTIESIDIMYVYFRPLADHTEGPLAGIVAHNATANEDDD